MIKKFLRALSAVLLLFHSVSSPAQNTGHFLGLKVPATPEGLTEGPTDYRTNLHPVGNVRAIMLFALFPDTVNPEQPMDLYNRLVPGGVQFFEKYSFGKMHLKVDTLNRWLPMDHPTTWPGYDCSRFESQRAYLAEAIGKAEKEVDFSKYDVVYVVGSTGKGLPNSPTFIAPIGSGIRASGKEMRLGVTFGRDCRRPNWGWQTLCHETGHICGLPDLYLFGVDPHPYKNLHTGVGFWDIMGFQAVGSPYLAWQRRKLDWLTDSDFAIITPVKRTLWIAPLDMRRTRDVAAAAIPVSDTEAIVCEVRNRDPEDGGTTNTGLLVYRVNVSTDSGHGPVKILPAAADSLDTASEKRYITLYNALYTPPASISLKQEGITIELLGRRADGSIQIRVTR